AAAPHVKDAHSAPARQRSGCRGPSKRPSRVQGRAPDRIAAMPRILVAEDDQDIAQLVARYLDKAGYTTEVAGTGRDALTAAAARPPDLLILDLMLPHVDGLDACRALRAQEKTAGAPVT